MQVIESVKLENERRRVNLIHYSTSFLELCRKRDELSEEMIKLNNLIQEDMNNIGRTLGCNEDYMFDNLKFVVRMTNVQTNSYSVHIVKQPILR